MLHLRPEKNAAQKAHCFQQDLKRAQRQNREKSTCRSEKGMLY
jgi:hypothetical protein